MENILNNENLTEYSGTIDDTLSNAMHASKTESRVENNEAVKAYLIEQMTATKVSAPTTVIENNDIGEPILHAKTHSDYQQTTSLDLSDMPIDESDSFSSVLGNLDDEPMANYTDNLSMRGNDDNDVHYHKEVPVDNEPVSTVKNDVNFGVNFGADEIDFSQNIDSVGFSAEEALSDEVIKQSKDEEKYVYKSYADQKIAVRANNPKLSFLDNMTVDLEKITINKKSPIQQVEDINTMFNNNVATFTVTCCQSGYWASMSGLTLAEKNAINNSDGGSLFQFRQKLYHTVYNKIQSMSIPKPNFNNWLKITSFNDLSTLLFGIYCQTFIDNNDFDITCGKCGNTTSVTVNNQTLVEVRDRSVFEKRDEIIGSIENGEQLIAQSIVHKDERIMLNESKIIVDVSTPSLHDHLTLLQSSKQETLQEYADTFSAMLFISHLYMLDIRETYSTGSPSYYEIEDKARLLNILLKLSNNDGEQLENAIQDKLGKYQINYEIHNVTCSHCKTELPGIPVDMETILFTRVNRTNTEK